MRAGTTLFLLEATALGVLTLCYSLAIARLYSDFVPDAYMDEVFHVPQAKAYCRGQWKRWDPKLTTPPGLYIVSVAVGRALETLLGSHVGRSLCTSTRFLRQTNSLLFSVLPAVVLSLGRRRSKTLGVARASGWLEALVIPMLPPLFFFQHLYYTDVGSTLAVLAMLSAAQADRHGLAGVLGFASLWFRQTNIIWVTFALCTSLVSVLRSSGLFDPPLQEGCDPLRTLTTLPTSLGRVRPVRLARILGCYLPALGAFLAFIHWNGGSIVLGDKEHHVATLHGAQPAYLLGFSLVFGAPSLVASLGGVRGTAGAFASAMRRRGAAAALVALAAALTYAVANHTIVHPFLLSDNRHYTFYLWRKLLGRGSWGKYAPMPAYVLSAVLWTTALARSRSLIWMLGFTLASCLTLIPSPLIEPRYYLVPFLVMRTSLPVPHVEKAAASRRAAAEYSSTHATAADEEPSRSNVATATWLTGLLLEATWYACINAVTIYVFLRRPFLGAGDGGVATGVTADGTFEDRVWQRFMW